MRHTLKNIKVYSILKPKRRYPSYLYKLKAMPLTKITKFKREDRGFWLLNIIGDLPMHQITVSGVILPQGGFILTEDDARSLDEDNGRYT